MARAEGFGVIVGGAIALGDSDLPYGPFTEAFRSLLADVGRERIIEAAGGRRRPPRPAGARPRRRAGLALVHSPDDGVDSRPRLFETVLDVLGRLALERPIVLVLEDLHWADPSSRALLTFLAGRLRDERLVLIGTYRSDELTRRHPLLPLLALLERLPSVERIDLSRLDRDEVQAQIAGILGTVPGARFVDDVLGRSDGNPFFVEELLTSSSRDRRGVVSPTLQEILLARLSGLAQETQRVLRIAAVIGRRAEHDLLASVADRAEPDLVDDLRDAVDQHVLVPVETDGGPAYDFRHALVREVAYEDLLPTERSALHALVAEALTTRGPADWDGDARLTAELAYHWHGAHDDRRAIGASVRAGRAAAAVFAHDEALEHFERAIRLWSRVADPEAETGTDLASLYDSAAAAASSAGSVRRAVELARSAVETGSGARDQTLGEAWARRTDRLAWYLSELGDQAGALAVVDHALGWVGSDFPGIGTARLLTTRGVLLWGMGRYPEIVRTADATIAAARRSGDVGIEASALLGVGAGRAAYGLLDEGIADLREAHALFLAAADPRSGIAVSQLSYALCLGGRHVEAEAVIRDELDRQAQIGTLRRFRPFLVTDLVDGYIDLGRWDEAVALCETELAEADGGRPAPWYLEITGRDPRHARRRRGSS